MQRQFSIWCYYKPQMNTDDCEAKRKQPPLASADSQCYEHCSHISQAKSVPLFQASSQVQKRIETLLLKQQQVNLSVSEEQELDCYFVLIPYTLESS